MVERNITLDYFKIILSLLVIAIHTYPLFGHEISLSSLSWIISNGIARIAVPCFFIINGYYLFDKINSPTKIWKYCKKLLILYLVWNIIYLPQSYTHWFKIKTMITTVIFGYHHLWYIIALVGSVAICFFLKKTGFKSSHMLILSITLVLLGYALQWFIFVKYGDILWKVLSRNALFLGFPFLFLGIYIKEKYDKIISVETKYLWMSMFVSAISFFIEIWNSYNMHFTQDLFLSLIPLCAVLFILVIRSSKYVVDNDSAYLGSLTTGMYLIHPYVIYFVYILLMFHRDIDMIIRFPLIVLISMILSSGIINVNKKIKIFL